MPGACGGPAELNPASGNVVVRLAPPSAGPFDPTPILVYNSQEPAYSEFGWGWSLVPKQTVVSLTAASVNVLDGTGTPLRYRLLDPGTNLYQGPGGGNDALQFNPGDGSWTQTQPDGFLLPTTPTGGPLPGRAVPGRTLDARLRRRRPADGHHRPVRPPHHLRLQRRRPAGPHPCSPTAGVTTPGRATARAIWSAASTPTPAASPWPTTAPHRLTAFTDARGGRPRTPTTAPARSRASAPRPAPHRLRLPGPRPDGRRRRRRSGHHAVVQPGPQHRRGDRPAGPAHDLPVGRPPATGLHRRQRQPDGVLLRVGGVRPDGAAAVDPGRPVGPVPVRVHGPPQGGRVWWTSWDSVRRCCTTGRATAWG